MSKFGVTSGLGLGLLGFLGGASAFSPAQLQAASPADEVQQTSFFGRPYPYGYTGWARCTRYVEVQTPYGVHLRRVRVCR
jgi:hypothetical protein